MTGFHFQEVTPVAKVALVERVPSRTNLSLNPELAWGSGVSLHEVGSTVAVQMQHLHRVLGASILFESKQPIPDEISSGSTITENEYSESALDKAWSSYLVRLRESFSPPLLRSVNLVMATLRTLAPGALEYPIGYPSTDGLAFAWESTPHFFEIEFHESGKVSWFYRDRAHDHNEGGDEVLPEELLSETTKRLLRLASVI